MKGKLCLAIETTGAYLGLALHAMDSGRAIARFFEPTPGKQSDLLFPTLDRLLRKSKTSKADLALVAVDNGPGSFTGVRVGVASARALAQALGLPLIGVSALEALARAAADTVPAGELTVAARIPALAGEAYFASYRRAKSGAWSIARKPCWTTDADVDAALKKAKGPLCLAAIERAGAPPLPLPSHASVRLSPAPDPSVVARIAWERAGRAPAAARFPLEKTVPVYLQPSWAERTKKARDA